ncbi:MULTISPECIES: class I SAM-dependent methyltransferase [Tsukamurella]|uniref:Class I SAM-dependent methyltransferase n=2 Tax=Tsukamurella TaxID=2060 RepID=A0A5C5RYU8_9ACTN|nr:MULTISPECIES: class I SAM-dependent methyltransferase [Tsukamurella]NMD57108.1 class I SAM-dependent methyltransferase [Tsukamurella columbiensis]TWS27668.1 class I SAM-dependent methyltransferase [Tsukamurella conjunctivitidis]
MTQPGYDALADLYAETFPDPYQFPIERHAAAAFAEAAAERPGRTVDVGCGLGHVAADLAERGLDVVGVDPSAGMLTHARRLYPELPFVDGDASLAALPSDVPIAAILARFSLIHVAPAQVRAALRGWAGRVDAGTPVLVAFQAADEPGPPIAFDHVVAPAWRWNPDAFAQALADAGFSESWRIIHRDKDYRFPMAQLLAVRA